MVLRIRESDSSTPDQFSPDPHLRRLFTPDFDQVQVDKEVTSTHNVEGGVHGRNKPNKEKEISGPS
jgi:hypothetical protein